MQHKHATENRVMVPHKMYAKNLLHEIKGKANKKEGHISLGLSYKVCKNLREKQNKSPPHARTNTMPNSVVIVQWNPRSLNKKVDNFKRTILESNTQK